MSDTRIHGPEFCPRVCSECVCDDDRSRHHWIETGFDPTQPEDERDPVERAVLDYDREHGTEHGLAYFQCKHCPAWAEAEFKDDLPGDDYEEVEVDSVCLGCGQHPERCECDCDPDEDADYDPDEE